ncbi:MAG: hypothetical protein LBT04_09650 [Prevotellaceae bacterium]|jgi:cell division protein FtsL|nr:hypothetical protein [Prevotellaceae bacterium]
MGKAKKSTSKKRPTSPKSSKRKKTISKIDKSVIWAAVVGILLAVGLIVYLSCVESV